MRLDASVTRFAVLAVALPSLVMAWGCNDKDAAKCTESQGTIRQALTAENFDSARQWRDYAYKQCEDQGTLASLDKEIAEREAAVKARKDAEQAKKQETQQLLKLFTDFVAQHRAAPDRASATPACDPPAAGAPADSKDRFCTASRVAGNYTLQVRFWQADPTAFRFIVRPDEPVTCDALGPATVTRTWDVAAVGGAAAKRHRCDLGGPLSGLHAVVSEAAKAEVSVFSPQYLERDPGMKPILSGP